jgi:hypothetical protein
MLVKLIHYERLVNLGNYENEKLGIDVEIEPGETVEEAIQRARAVVDDGLTAIYEARQADMRRRVAEEAAKLKKAFGQAPQVQRDPGIVEDEPF